MNDNNSHSAKLASGTLGFEEFYERQDQNDSSFNDANKMKKSGKWTAEEDELLNKYVPIYGEKQWRKIADYIPGRSSIQCLHRWTKILKPGLVKGPWTQEEDQKLIAWVQAEGPTKWAQAASFIKGRSGKQCRERWFNNLCPGVKKGNWSEEEDEMIFQLYQKYGSSWSKIAKYIPGRTENAIKNRFYATLRKIAADKKKTCLENSSNNIKRELSDNFSNDDEESKTVTPKPVVNLDDQKRNTMELENSQVDTVLNSPTKMRMTEKQDLNSDKMEDIKSNEKGAIDTSCKKEQRTEPPNFLLMDNAQNALYKLLNQDTPSTDASVKEKKEGSPDGRAIASNSDAQEKTFKSKQTESAASSFLKEVSREVFSKKLLMKRTPSFQNNKTMTKREEDEDDDDEDFNTIEKMKKKFSSIAKPNATDSNDTYQSASSLGLDFENPRNSGMYMYNLANQQDFPERNAKTRPQYNEPVMSRFELNSKNTQMPVRSQTISSPVLGGLPSPKIIGESYRTQSHESTLAMTKRDLLNDIDSDFSRRNVKEESWTSPDMKPSAFSKREPIGHSKQRKSSFNEDFEGPYKKQQMSRANLESLGFDLPQSRNVSSGNRNYSQNQFVYNQLSKFTGRDAFEMEEEEAADAIQLSLADELLSGLKGNMNQKNRSGSGIRGFSQPVGRELGNSGLNINSNQKNVAEEVTAKSDDKISSLFQQLHSLESLLSTTRSELNKMEGNTKQEESFIENPSTRKNLEFNPMGLRMSNLRREDNNFNESFLLKRRY